MQEILGDPVEVASGTPEGGREAPKVRVCVRASVFAMINPPNVFTQLSRLLQNYCLLHRPIQRVQDRKDDHGEEFPACYHLQLQQERM